MMLLGDGSDISWMICKQSAPRTNTSSLNLQKPDALPCQSTEGNIPDNITNQYNVISYNGYIQVNPGPDLQHILQ